MIDKNPCIIYKSHLICQVSMKNINPNCFVCNQPQSEVPLIQFQYKDIEYHVCPEHLPIMIHSPQKLTGLLPDAEKLKPHNQ